MENSPLVNAPSPVIADVTNCMPHIQTSAEDSKLGRTLDLGRLDALLGFHLRMASAAVAKDFARVMAEFGITQMQYAVLELTAGNSGVSQIDIAELLDSDRATMMAVVDRLVGRGLVEKLPSIEDRRRLRLVLTDEARTLLPRLRRAIDDHEQHFVGLLRSSPATREKLFGSLRKLQRRQD